MKMLFLLHQCQLMLYIFRTLLLLMVRRIIIVRTQISQREATFSFPHFVKTSSASSLSEIISLANSEEVLNTTGNTDYLQSAVEMNHRTFLPTFIPSHIAIAFSNDLLSNQKWIFINASRMMDHISFVCESNLYTLKKSVNILIQDNRDDVIMMRHCAQIINNYTKCR